MRVVILEWLDVAWRVALVAGMFVSVIVQLRTQFNVGKIEKATNSMKDALVAATAKSAGLEGEARGRAAQSADNNIAPG